MTQLLVSVKNVDEALMALNAGVDIIDLKDPANGALGALDLAQSAQIVIKTQQYNHFNLSNNAHFSPVLTSATVGEHHPNLDALMNAVLQRAQLNIDIIKVAVSTLLSIENWQNHFNKQKFADIKSDIKLVAVFFADEEMDFTLLETLKKMGFYGAMLDTSEKSQSLLEICTMQTLQIFTQLCQKNALKSGLAGSLKSQHIAYLIRIRPLYIGFRGGVCEANERNSILEIDKVIKVKELLHEHNKLNDLARQSSSLALLS